MKYIFAILSLYLLAACQQQNDAGTGAGGSESRSATIQVALYESQDQILPAALAWRGGTLVLLTDNPLLAPLPESLRGEIARALMGAPAELSQRLGRVADPLLMPEMTVRAALESKLFQRIVWVVPSRNAQEKLNLEKFKGLLQSAGLDGELFRQGEGGTLTGTLQGVPFDVVHPGALPALSGPVVLHLDLGFFVALYDGEVKTPLIPLVGSILAKVRERGWNASMVTFSYSNHTGRVPLSMRPLGQVIARLFAEPNLLDQPMPTNWELWGKALYLENFFQKEEIGRVLTQMEKNDPRDPGVKYLLYRISRHEGDLSGAEKYLEGAVAEDRGYALEYLMIADEMREAKKQDRVLEYLRKLAAAYPGDPHFQLTLCEELMAQRRYAEARKLLPQLSALSWSPIYYPEVVPTLERWREILNKSTD